MNEESRVKIYEIFSKNGLLFALVGCVLVIIAILTPVVHVEWHNVIATFTHIHVIESKNLWIYGLYEHNISFLPPSPLITQFHLIEWFGEIETTKLGFATISIASTVVIGLSVLSTTFTATYTLVRKRKIGVYSSRVALFCSIGVFGALHAYMWQIPFYAGVGHPDFFKINPLLFITGSILILMGYSTKIIPLIKIISLFLASSLILYGVMELLYFFSYLIMWPVAQPIPLETVMNNAIRYVIPASIALFGALLIVIVNFILYMKGRKAKK